MPNAAVVVQSYRTWVREHHHAAVQDRTPPFTAMSSLPCELPPVRASLVASMLPITTRAALRRRRQGDEMNTNGAVGLKLDALNIQGATAKFPTKVMRLDQPAWRPPRPSL